MITHLLLQYPTALTLSACSFDHLQSSQTFLRKFTLSSSTSAVLAEWLMCLAVERNLHKPIIVLSNIYLFHFLSKFRS